MNKKHATFFCILFMTSILLCGCGELGRDTKIEGYVFNETTGQPIPGVTVGFYSTNVFNHKIIGTTDNNGHFSLKFSYSNSNSNMDYIDIELMPYVEVISEGPNYQEHELHNYTCLDSLSHSTSYRIFGSGDHYYEFKVIPQAKLKFYVYANPSLDVDSLILRFPNALCCIEKSNVSKQKIDNCGGTSSVFGTIFTTLGDMNFKFEYLGYKNGSVVLQDSVLIFTERFHTKSFSYTIQ